MSLDLERLLGEDDVKIVLARTNYGREVADSERMGVAAHYDASRTDRGAEQWFDDPAFKLSYGKAYTDGGRRIGFGTLRHRHYHMGKCRVTNLIRDANVAFYGLAVTAGQTSADGRENPRNPETNAVVTLKQFTRFAYDAAVIARYHQLTGTPTQRKVWDTDLVDTWLTEHSWWASPAGRKVDPTGDDEWEARVGYQVLPINSLRSAVATLLDSPQHDIWLRFPR